jgi:hypothetical protein
VATSKNACVTTEPFAHGLYDAVRHDVRIKEKIPGFTSDNPLGRDLFRIGDVAMACEDDESSGHDSSRPYPRPSR